MKTPIKIEKGDEVRIISTARAISHEELKPAIETLKGWGLNVSLGKSLFKIDGQFAGSTEDRTKDFQEAIDDPNVRGIIFARGGYGSVKVIDKINFSSLIKDPKWLIGYSDITVIHSHLNRNVGVMSLHATMPVNFTQNSSKSIESLKNCMQNGKNLIQFDSHLLNRKGDSTGQLVGGNLSIIYSLLGSPSDIDTDGKILFIEDIDEYLYHIDRIMMNLKRSGKLDKLSGLIVGGFTQMNDNDIPFGKDAHQIILSSVAEYDFPVAFGLPAGHIDDNRCLYMGAESRLIVKGKVVDFEQLI